MAALKDAGRHRALDDGMPVADSHIMHMALRNGRAWVLLISLCEYPRCKRRRDNEGYWSRSLPQAHHRGPRRRWWPREISWRARYTRVHIAHCPRGGIDNIRAAKPGRAVTAEPAQYFSATDSWPTVQHQRQGNRRCADRDVAAVKAALKDGTLDCIVTDHAPHHVDQKNVEFSLAANGISGFETAFPLAYTNLVRTGVLTLEELVLRMSSIPAEILGIEGGVLAEGALADVTLVDENASYVIDPADFVSKGKNSPFGGFAVSGRHDTWRACKIAVRAGQVSYK